MYYGIKPGDPEDVNNFYYPFYRDVDDVTDERDNKKAPANQAETDAKSLHKVTKEGERPHDILIKSLATRSYRQRLKIKKKYKELYQTDLEEDLKRALGGEWNLLIEALFNEEKSHPPQALGKVIKSGDAPALVRRLTPLTNNELADLKEDYLKENSESLEHDISAKFDSPTDMLLLTLVKGTKREKEQTSDSGVERDAKALLEHGDGRWTSESGKFVLLLEQKTPAYMSRVFDRYKLLNKGKSAVKAVYDECPRDYADALAAYINCTETAGSETIDRLHKNLDATNPTFVKTVVVRSEIDMPKVKKDYRKKYGNDLGVDLEQRSSHTTVSVLKAIINKTPQKQKTTRRRQDNTTGQKRSRSLSPSERQEQREEEEMLRQERLQRLREQEELYLRNKEDYHSPHNSPRHHKDGEEDGKYKHGQDKDKGTKSDQDNDKKKDEKKDEKEKKYNPDEDAKRLYNAMKGLGTDEDAIVEIIPQRSNAERQAIRKRYQELYKQDLMADLKSETSGDFQEVVEALMLPPVEFDAFSLHKAMEGLGTDETALIGIICSKTPSELEEIKKVYKKEHKSDLETDVRKDTSGDFKEMLLNRLSTKNTKQDTADKKKAETDATTLHLNPTADTLREIFNGMTSKQIKATADAHRKLFSEDISESIKKASSGDAEYAYLALAAGQDEDQSNFYADRLHSSVSGLGTNDNQLIRILVSRSEVDLPAITAAYQSRHGQPLKEAVTKDTSGDYGKVLVKIIEKAETKQDQGNKMIKKQEPKRENKAAVEKRDKPKDAMAAAEKRDGREKKNTETTGARDKGTREKRNENVDRNQKQKPEKKKEEEEDAVKLFNAMKNQGTDEDIIIEVITRNSNAGRQALRQRYQTLYKEDLMADLKSETSGDFQEVLEALMLPPVEFDAFSLNKAMEGLGTDETALISIICSKTPAELEEIKKVYKREYNKDLESDIKKETSGDFQSFFLHLLSGKTSKAEGVNKDKAERDARALHDIPTSHEIKALFMESPAQIAATAKAHQELFDADIEFSIKKATSGDAEKAYLATLRSQEDLTLFYAKQLENALGGLGTNDTLLIWTLVSRSEIDLPAIKSHYQRVFGRSLTEDVKKDTSGDYGKTLIKILDKAGEEKSKKKDEKKPAKKTSPTRTAAPSNKNNAKEGTKKAEEPKKSPRGKKETESKTTKLDEDATKLYKAMNGVGTDEDTLVEVIVRNSNSERQNVKKRYQELYQQDLLKDLKSETSGDFHEVLEALMLPPVEFDALSLNKAMKGLGTDETALIGIICSKTPAELEEIKKVYKKNHQKDLESEVEKETSGQLRDLLMKLLSAKVSKGESVDKNKADTDARLLHETPSQDIITGIFIKGSSAQVLATTSSHKYFYGEDIAESIKKACSGDEEKAYLAYTGALQNLVTFYTERLHSSMEGMGTKETQLTRILVSTLETDLPAIKGKYKSLYGQPLRDVVKKETSGDYQKVLLALLDKVGEVKVEEKQGRAQSVSSRGPAEDAIKIYKAMHRVGTEEDVVVEIVCKLSNTERQQLKKRYFELYKQDLEKDLRSELTGDFEDTIMALMVPADNYDARCLHEAMKGFGTDETTLIGIVCSKDPSQMEKLRQSYKQAYSRDLEMDIVGETSGDLRELLLALAMGKRDSSSRTDKKTAQENAKSVHDDPTPDNLRRVLVSSSIAQAQATITAYREQYKEEMSDLIKRATSGDLEKAYVAVVKAMGDESTFYAERIHTAMKGAGTNEAQLTRIIIARSEVDLPAIKVKYSKLYGPSLKKDIGSDTSGDYRRTLLKLIDHWGGPELPEDKPSNSNNNKPGKSERNRR
ncbi:annexin [Elysia marginata]|uniref:Annexin n=1 Tax=Elysia marginata TaxID=1093978 RepID=A0AAV4IFF3_9GAST|nr:annexin [Elysia marginata]